MRIKSIASGSSGNSIYVGDSNTHILVDVGISKIRIEKGLNELGLSGKDINALLITHEHSDHIGGLGVFLRKYPIPVYATKGTIEGIKSCRSLGEFDYSLLNEIETDSSFRIKEICVSSLRTSHDANEPCAYRFDEDNKSCAVVTDLGCYDDYLVEKLQRLDSLFIESNHDIRMLELGPYPYELKRRILGKKGHLSNEASGRLLNLLLHDNMKHVYLSHLSKENNLPELAYEAVRMEVNMSDSEYNADDFDIQIARRDMPMIAVEF